MPRILLIEDDDSVRNMLRQTLELMGHAITEARNGKEGLALYQSANIDVVLTDIIMPDVEGMQVIRELRRQNPAVKIIAMSGGGRMNARDYLRMAQKLGAARILPKPFLGDELAAAIREVLAEKPAAPGGG